MGRASATTAQRLGQEGVDRLRALGRRAQVGTVPDVLDHVQGAGRQVAVQVVAHRTRGDQVVAALQDQGRHRRQRQVGAVVRQEGDAGEMLGDPGVVAAEAVGQFLAQVRTFGNAHDGRGHAARPAEVVRFHRIEQLVDVGAAEAAHVVAVVDVAGRGADHDLGGEALGRLDGGEQADHGADRVADEDHGAGGAAGVEDLQHIFGVAVQAAVPGAVVGAQVGAAAAGEVVGKGAVAVRESRGHEAPHGLVAAETMCEHHRRRAVAGDAYIIPGNDGHDTLGGGS